MALELIIKEATIDLLSWLGVEEAAARVISDGEEGGTVHYRVEVTASSPSLLIGTHGDTLAAFQHMLRILVGHRATEADSRIAITVDIDGYLKRKVELTLASAERRAQEVSRHGTSEKLPPMNAYFRRTVHLFIAEKFPDLTTESLGSGAFKVVLLRKK